jgi:hypothetical protein
MLSASKSGSGLSTGYNLTRSLRFRRSATGHLSRTPATTTNRRTWTWSGWAKRGELGTNQSIFNDTGPLGNNDDSFGFNFSVNNEFVVGTGSFILLTTTSVFRDPSAYYHIVVVLDTTQATANDRIKVYINNVQVTSFSTNTIAANIPQNFQAGVNTANLHNIGNLATVGGRNFDGYLAEVNFIDGQALTPSSFGSTNSVTGVWQPARYTGTYGTNGFYLPFTDNSALTTASNVGLGKDFSGNGNYWTTNNISITAGVTYDSMTDVPTLTSATAANFAVLNPLTGDGTISNANLTIDWVGGNSSKPATIGVTSGKWYCEITLVAAATNAMFAGIIPASMIPSAGYPGSASGGYGFFGDGQKYFNGVNSAYGTAISVGQIVGIAFDLDNGKLWFSRNGTWQASGDPAAGTNAAFTSIAAGTWFLSTGHSGSCTLAVNFGQRPFTYTPPTGFVALNTFNLPTSTIVKGNTVMDATLYTGTLLSNSITNAAAFKPDLVWVKGRSIVTNNKLTDSVRGVTKAIISNSTNAETTDTQGVTAFNTNGFTVGTDTTYNSLADTYVGWQWQAGQGSSSSNTNGSITSTVSVNASAGFSIATFTGTGANGTVGHGLGVAPSMYIVKSRSAVGDWWVYHVSLGAGKAIFLSLTDAAASSTGYWNNTAPTSSVFSVGTAGGLNVNGVTQVAYCWAAIAGFSAFGSYTGNGSADGPFTYLGFRPKYVVIKRTNDISNWNIYDSSRSTYNVNTTWLNANLSDAESSAAAAIDFLSNGFKNREAGGGATNASGSTYIYMAFAENPFKNALAR